MGKFLSATPSGGAQTQRAVEKLPDFRAAHWNAPKIRALGSEKEDSGKAGKINGRDAKRDSSR